jgi:hypothetical protein
MMRKFALAAALGFAIAMPPGAGAKDHKVTPHDIPIVKRSDKASASLATRDASTGQPSGKRSHRAVRAAKRPSSKPVALTPAAPSPQPLPYPNSTK